MFPLSTLTIKG